MALDQATVNIPLSDWTQTRQKIEKLEKQLSDAYHLVEQVRLGDRSSDTRRLACGLDLAIHIVRFAIGHLDPLTVRGWPHRQLYDLANMLADLPGIDPMSAELAGDLKLFARQAREWEEARARGEEQQKLAAESAAKMPVDFGKEY